MGINLGYRRPAYVDREQFRQSCTSVDNPATGSVKSGSSGSSTGIPPALTFDKIISGGTCPPMTTRDFMNYLVYIEHSAENLQFYLWYQDYSKRFAEAPASQVVLSPEWTQAMQDDALAKIQKESAEKNKPAPEGAEIFKGTDFEKEKEGGVITTESSDPFSTPPQTPPGTGSPSVYSGNPSNATSHHSQAQEAFSDAGAAQPFTIQPLRMEIDRVIANYIVVGAPRQLNLSSRERKVLLQALSFTTHPSAFRAIAEGVETTLRRQAHPNFVRWSICNGNPARVWFARGLGVGVILLSTVAALILTLSSVGRGWRALAAIGWVIGISTLVAAYKGMCVVLHGMHHRHIRPWELFADSEEEIGPKTSMDTIGSSNSWEEEPWVVRYKKRNIIRKVFDREVWVRERALRRIQDAIFIQSMLSALVGAAVLSAIFVAVPAGNFF